MRYWDLDKLGRVRLSKHFYMRQFFYSEIAAFYRISNVPDDPDLAIYTGRKLCETILEPLTETYGPLVIRSGFRSARLNAYGAQKRLGCAANEKNFAYHIWDHRDAEGYAGAAACVVIPSFVDAAHSPGDWKYLASHIHQTLPYHRLAFFKRDFAFNIGWHEKPRKEIFSRIPSPHWYRRCDSQEQLALD